MAPTLSLLAESWSAAYANSAPLRTTIGFAHVAGLVGGGGCAVAADRATLLAYRRDAGARMRQLQALRGIHGVVLAGLSLVTVSGLLLLLADLEAYLGATTFWAKMALVAALLSNGVVLFRASRRAERDDRAWSTLRWASVTSLTLWFLTTLAGAALPNAL